MSQMFILGLSFFLSKKTGNSLVIFVNLFALDFIENEPRPI